METSDALIARETPRAGVNDTPKRAENYRKEGERLLDGGG
jgi:hypothetical protein